VRFPEEFNISAVSDTQFYKQMGNSVSVPVIRAIAKKMTVELKRSAAKSQNRVAVKG